MGPLVFWILGVRPCEKASVSVVGISSVLSILALASSRFLAGRFCTGTFSKGDSSLVGFCAGLMEFSNLICCLRYAESLALCCASRSSALEIFGFLCFIRFTTRSASALISFQFGRNFSVRFFSSLVREGISSSEEGVCGAATLRPPLG